MARCVVQDTGVVWLQVCSLVYRCGVPTGVWSSIK